jgi:putative flippase GtrA
MDLLIIISSILLLFGLFLVIFTNRFLDYISTITPTPFNFLTNSILSWKGKERETVTKVIGFVIIFAALVLFSTFILY